MSHKDQFQTQIHLTLIVLLGVLSACGTSSVGGKYSSGRTGSTTYEHIDTNCAGYCVGFSGDGTCVNWSSDISDVCIDFFTRTALIKTKTLNEDALRKMSETLVALCRGGTLAGKRRNFRFEAQGESKSQALAGTKNTRMVQFTETEWQGIQADIRQGYSQCIRSLTPKFIEKLSS